MHSVPLSRTTSERPCCQVDKQTAEAFFSKTSSWIQSLFKASERGTKSSNLHGDDKLQEKDSTSYIVHIRISRAFDFV